MEKWMVFLVVGVVLVILGIFNMKGNISTIHWYNRRRVAGSDIPKYGKCVGAGTLMIGASLIISVLFESLFKTAVWDNMVLLGCVAGLAVVLYGQFRYNKGIF